MSFWGSKGYVYFAMHPDGDRIKIGLSARVRERMGSLRRKLGVELEVLLEVESDSYFEVFLHEKFRHLSIGGEWFKYDDDLRAYIESEQPQKDGRSFKRLMAPIDRKHRLMKEKMESERRRWMDYHREQVKHGLL